MLLADPAARPTIGEVHAELLRVRTPEDAAPARPAALPFRSNRTRRRRSRHVRAAWSVAWSTRPTRAVERAMTASPPSDEPPPEPDAEPRRRRSRMRVRPFPFGILVTWENDPEDDSG
jgi:hypothetical protein